MTRTSLLPAGFSLLASREIVGGFVVLAAAGLYMVVWTIDTDGVGFEERAGVYYTGAEAHIAAFDFVSR